MSRPVQKRSVATRAKVVGVARGLFAAAGFEDVSVDEICGAARISKGAFYHHFQSKEALFLEIAGQDGPSREAVGDDGGDHEAPAGERD